jgi:tyrosyl-tRNA synthetase
MARALTGLIDELRWRGLLYAATDGAEAAFASGRAMAGYVGFDPTADSLHVGHLLPIMTLVRLNDHGHRGIALIGGGTGLIGDPSGKNTERSLADRDTVQTNAKRIGDQLAKFGLELADNAEWLTDLAAIDLLRDTGKHFTVNYMLQKDSVKSRMDAGISFTEFAYMLLQAYDFLQLYKRYDVTVQLGGSDQWGNITAGIELIRRTVGGDAYGLTSPLITTASGAKFGKTEAGAVWLDATKTSPYRFYQFWINVDDSEVGKYLKYFTLLDREAIDALLALDPAGRAAQRQLALDVTTRVHGVKAAETAREVSELLFGRGDPWRLSPPALDSLMSEIPFKEIKAGPTLLDLMVELQLSSSKGDARRVVQQGGVSVNGTKITPDQLDPAGWPRLLDKYLLIKKGSRDYGLVRLID